MKRFLAALITWGVFLSITVATQQEADDWASALHSQLSSLLEQEVGVSSIQALFDGAIYLPLEKSVADADTLASALSSRFASRGASIGDVASSAETFYAEAQSSEGTPDGSDDLCCGYDIDLDDSPEIIEAYKRPVNLDGTCYRIPEGTDENNEQVSSAIKWTSRLINSYRAFEGYGVGVYFGSETGIFRSYPAARMAVECSSSECLPSCSGGCASYHFACSKSNCPNYDPRIRPWYIGAATPQLNVVLVIDRSGSMGDYGRMENTKQAVQTVLSTIPSTAQFGLVFFSSEVEGVSGTINNRTVPECFENKLMEASPANLDTALSYLERVEPGGSTNYASAITKARQMISSSNTGGLDAAIIFLSDGDPTAGTTSPTALRSHFTNELTNAQLSLSGGGQIGFFAYALGGGVNRGLLSDLALDWDGEPYGPGLFRAADDGEDLRSVLSGFYKAYSTGAVGASVKWSEPYCDASGHGIMTTGTMPAYDGNGELIGVAGVDFVLSDLFEEAVGYTSENSYAFIVDSSMRTYLHPLLAPPGESNRPPQFQDIIELETDAAFIPVREELKLAAATTGDYNVTLVASVPRVIPRGDYETEGGVQVPKTSYYSLRSIKDTNFAVCVVLETDALSTSQLAPQAAVVGDDLIWYHRIDSDGPNDAEKESRNADRYAGMWISLTESTVKFAPRVFGGLYDYLQNAEQEEYVEQLNTFLNTGDIDDELTFELMPSEQALAEARLTVPLTATWLRAAAADVSRAVIWRYIGTPEGTFRTFPGHPSDKTYDPARRTWFNRAVTVSGDIALSTPYEDASGAGQVVTLSRVVDGPESPAAVAAVDMAYGTVHSLMMRETGCPWPQEDTVANWVSDGPISQSKVCLVIDQSMYVALSDRFVQLDVENGEPSISTDPKDYEDADLYSKVFLGDLAPGLASSLLSSGVFSPDSCTNYQAGTQLRYFTLSTGAGASGSISGSCGEAGAWAVSQIGNSNLLMVVIDDYRRPSILGMSNQCLCPSNLCPVDDLTDQEYLCVGPRTCELPLRCESRVELDYANPTVVDDLPMSCPLAFSPAEPEFGFNWWVVFWWALASLALLCLACLLAEPAVNWCHDRRSKAGNRTAVIESSTPGALSNSSNFSYGAAPPLPPLPGSSAAEATAPAMSPSLNPDEEQDEPPPAYPGPAKMEYSYETSL